jgi:hypothetical protein
MSTTRRTFIQNSLGVIGAGLFAPSLLALPAWAQGPKNLVLIQDGQPRCVIVAGENAAPPEKHAVEELRAYFKKATGADVPVVAFNELPPRAFPIFLGTPDSQPAVARLGVLAKARALSEEAFILKANEQGLIITAKEPIGVLYGAYTFIENVLGVRWLMPGEDGEFVPAKKTVAIGTMESAQNPAFAVRTLVLTATNINAPLKDTWNWMARNKMRPKSGYKAFWEGDHAELVQERGITREGGGHVLAAFVPNELFEAHPEYFALINGQRRRSGASAVDGPVYQRCTSNPAVVELGVQYILKFFRDKPAGDAFLIGNNDGNGWCECADCRAQDDPWEAERGIVSTRFFKYINAVAGKVLQEFPDKKIKAWGYQLYRTAPRGVVPDPRLNIEVALHGRCYRHALDDPNCPTNATMRDILAGWKRFESNIGVREYYSCSIGGDIGSFIQYLPLEDIVARDIKYAARTGLRIWDDETPPPDGVFGKRFDVPGIRESWRARFPMYYVAAKLLWNPNQDAAKLEDEAYQMYFGAAGEAMKSYRRLLVKAWQETPGHFIYGAAPIQIGQSLAKAGVEKQLLDYLDAADKAAGSDAVAKERIAQEREYFAASWQAMARQLEKSTAWNDVNAARREGALVVDGVLSEGDWAKTATTTGFTNKNDQIAATQTFAQILYDDEAIYFGLTMMEPSPAALVARYDRRDDNIWADDCVEVFLDPDKSGAQFYHFAVNSKGAVYDAKAAGGPEDKSFQSGCEAAARVLADRWIVELKIPLATLGAKVAAGDSWKVNIARPRRAGAEVEYSSWTDGGFNQPGSFRTVVFGSEPSPLQNGGFETVQELKDDKAKARFLRGWESGNDPVLAPLSWSLHESHPGKITIVTDGAHSGKNACKIEKGWMHNMFAAATDEKLRIEFWAKGQGAVQVMLFQYEESAEGKLKNVPTATLGTAQLTEQWTKYRFDQTIITPDVKRVALSLAAGGTLILDDVSVQKAKP